MKLKQTPMVPISLATVQRGGKNNWFTGICPSLGPFHEIISGEIFLHWFEQLSQSTRVI